MARLSALLALYVGKPPITCGFPHKGSVMLTVDIFVVNKQLRFWWFEISWRSCLHDNKWPISFVIRSPCLSWGAACPARTLHLLHHPHAAFQHQIARRCARRSGGYRLWRPETETLWSYIRTKNVEPLLQHSITSGRTITSVALLHIWIRIIKRWAIINNVFSFMWQSANCLSSRTRETQNFLYWHLWKETAWRLVCISVCFSHRWLVIWDGFRTRGTYCERERQEPICVKYLKVW